MLFCSVPMLVRCGLGSRNSMIFSSTAEALIHRRLGSSAFWREGELSKQLSLLLRAGIFGMQETN